MDQEDSHESLEIEEDFDFFNQSKKRTPTVETDITRSFASLNTRTEKGDLLSFSSDENLEEEDEELPLICPAGSQKELDEGSLVANIREIREQRETKRKEALEKKGKRWNISDPGTSKEKENQNANQMESDQAVKTQRLLLDSEEYNRQIQMFLFFTVTGHGGILQSVISPFFEAFLVSLIPKETWNKKKPETGSELVERYLEAFGPIHPSMQNQRRVLPIQLQIQSGGSLNLFQHQFLFIAFAKIFGFRARLVEIIDLRSYLLGETCNVFYKEFKRQFSKATKPKKQSKDLDEVSIRKEKKKRHAEMDFSSFVQEQVLAAANEVKSDDFESEKAKEKEKKEKESIDKMDEFLSCFKFVSKNQREKSGVTLQKRSSQAIPKRINDSRKHTEGPLERIGPEEGQESEFTDSFHKKTKKKSQKLNDWESQKAEKMMEEKPEELKELKTDSVKYWVELFEEDKFKAVDVLSGKIHSEEEEIVSFVKPKLHGVPGLFVIGLGWANEESTMEEEGNVFESDENHSPFVYLRDLTTRYVFEQWIKMLSVRKRMNLNYFLRDYLTLFFSFEKKAQNERLAPQDLVMAKIDLETIEAKERSYVPSKLFEFAIHPQYILQSSLGRYGWIRPGAQPIEAGLSQSNFTDVIYLRKDTAKLSSRLQWRMKGRNVKKGEQPVKSVVSQGFGGQETESRMTELFGEWQTEEFVPRLDENGKIPMNEHGNYEVFACPIPPGTVYIPLKGVERALKDERDIDYVPAVVGFEKGASGRSHAVVLGIVAHQKDEGMIRAKYKEMEEEIQRKERERSEKKCLDDWKEIFKQVIKSKAKAVQKIVNQRHF